MDNETVCEMCGVVYHRNGRTSNNLCSFCYLYGDDCSKCSIKEFCKKWKESQEDSDFNATMWEEEEDDIRKSHHKSIRYGGKYKSRGKEKQREP
jgi:hypothetical protein